ncbi:3-alpha-hydroxysteroid dehydrogenase, partial [Mycobacterium sp. ITM-2017-0098]
MRFDGKHAVVTGCASGIGAQVVRQLGALGARVTGLDVRAPENTSHLDDFVEIDLADPDSVDAAA